MARRDQIAVRRVLEELHRCPKTEALLWEQMRPRFCEDEVNKLVTRLSARGWLQAAGGRYALTSTGRKMLGQRSFEIPGILDEDI